MKVKLKTFLIVASVLIFASLQFTNPAHTNPHVDVSQALEAVTDVPPQISAIFERSCRDCHSNNTNWRWYTYVAPISWFTIGHVNDGRSELNFSEWGTYGQRMKQTRLNAICSHVEKGTMPLPSYTLVHKGASLSQDEVRAICEWTKSAGEQGPR